MRCPFFAYSLQLSDEEFLEGIFGEIDLHSVYNWQKKMRRVEKEPE